jgi:hypothetical protein
MGPLVQEWWIGGARGREAEYGRLPLRSATWSSVGRGCDAIPSAVPPLGGGVLSELAYKHDAQRMASWITTQLAS